MKEFDCVHFGDEYFAVSCVSKEACHQLSGYKCSKYESKNPPTKIETPTLDKMQKVKNESEKFGDFLKWIESKYYMRSKREAIDISDPTESFVPSSYSSYINVEELLAEYFDIDLAEAEREKREI